MTLYQIIIQICLTCYIYKRWFIQRVRLESPLMLMWAICLNIRLTWRLRPFPPLCKCQMFHHQLFRYIWWSPSLSLSFLSLKITDRKRRRDTPISKNIMLSVQSLRCSSAAKKKLCSIKLIPVVVLLAWFTLLFVQISDANQSMGPNKSGQDTQNVYKNYQ